jgi:hypothetical protein
VRVALGLLDGEEALGAGAARLVDDDQRLLHQLVLDDDALHQAGHLVGAAAGAGRNHELDRLGRLPRQGGRAGEREKRCRACTGRAGAELREDVLDHVCLL